MPELRRLLAEAAARLAGEDGSGALEAELLLAHVLGRDRVWLHAHAEAELPADARERFADLVRERARDRTPVAYLTGGREFFGLTLAMRRGVFIPRPETEGLVDRVAAWVAGREAGRDAEVLVDVCCGSGAIAVALARETGWRVMATDRSPEAVRLTRDNAASLGVGEAVTVLAGSLLEPLDGLSPRPRVRAVVSNPPYVTTAEMSGLAPDIARHEPALALEAGADGLDVVRALVRDAAGWLLPGGMLAMEIGAGQGGAVRSLLTEAGWSGVRVEADLAGRDRYALALRPAGPTG